MKFALSLRWFVGLAFLFLALALVAGYTLLSADYFIRGMDNITTVHMERTAQQYLQAGSENERRESQSTLGYRVFPEWQQVPESLRAHFDVEPQQANTLHKFFNRERSDPKRSIEFLFPYGQGDDRVYVTYYVSPETISAMVRSNSRAIRHKLWLISAVSALALSILIWVFLRGISRPMVRLVEWTGSLDPQTLQAAPPDFRYQELNQLAQLIRNSLSTVQDSLDREHRFLRHTSHELRTPIAVIRNNVQLLRKLQADDKEHNEPEQRAIERLDRASLTMKHVTETLLWLSRDSAERLPTSDVALDELVQRLAGEVEYLLEDKPVEVELDTEPCRLQVPDMVARIVLGNLIRNAFQHTWEGRVKIRQRGPSVEIINPQSDEDSDGNLGFGLGLKLTGQLCAKLNWSYVNAASNGERRAAIQFY
jgi:signal transduction histidine kinase